MSLFKRPKKNIRRRNVDTDEEDNVGNSVEQMEVEIIGNGVKKGKEKSKENDAPSIAATLLSFADDEEDHGEVFQVKKSSYSKKLEKKLGKERRRKKEKMEVEVIEPETQKDATEDNLVLVVKKEEEETARERQQKLILNGRAALMAGKNEASSSEDDEGSARYKFSQSVRSEIMIESGKIPDAATIHAARKRRQRARQLNLDYIPVETPTPKLKPVAKGTSRLVREEEEDGSDEERINMGTGLEANDLSARRANYYEHIEQGTEAETVEATPWPAVQPSAEVIPTPPLPPVATTKELAPPSQLTQRLKDRLAGLRELHSSHCQDVARIAAELKEHTEETKKLEAEAPNLASKFRFYQDMRGYVTDLVECLDEKVTGLEKLEESALKLWTDRQSNLVARRRLDVRDQADEMSQFPKSSSVPKWSREEEEARARRAAEREGRRSRRRRGRELRSLAVPHMEGMSSDDEETELEMATFLKKLGEIDRLSVGLLEDVEADFGTADGVCQRLESWRDFDITAYQEAYASLCLPKLLGPLLRHSLITWNPLQSDCQELDNTTWWNRLLLYGLREGETLQALRKDPDVLLIPTLLEKAILPKVADLVSSAWDPLSSSQTLRIVNFVNKFVVEMPGMSARSPQVTRLLEGILSRLRHAVDNDVFIPISFTGGEVKTAAPPFFQRQFASAVKLLRNMLTMQGLVEVSQLHEVALDGLLNRYLLAALRTCTPCDAIAKANMIISTFPRWWFQSETKMPKLEMLGRQLKHLSTQVHDFDTKEKDSCELVQSLLRTIQLACPNPL